MTRVMVSDSAEASTSDSVVPARKMVSTSRSKKTATTEKKVTTPRGRERLSIDDREHESTVAPVGGTVKEAQGQHEVPAISDDKEERPQVAFQDATELPPAQDTQLRRQYLQRMSGYCFFMCLQFKCTLGLKRNSSLCCSYRQLQSTHPSQDDATVRQLATTMEMATCQKAATRSHYIAAMEQEIHTLLELELEQTNDVQGFETMQGTSGYVPPEVAHSQSFEYAQALAKAQEHEHASPFHHSMPLPTPPGSSEPSFQALMTDSPIPSSLPPLEPRTRSTRTHHQSLDMAGYATSGSSPRVSVADDRTDAPSRRPMMGQEQKAPMQVTTFHDFSAQIQHLDKSVLIDLLWNQRKALARWQTQAKQLQLQLAAQRPTVDSPASLHSPMKAFVDPHVAAQAEMQRARERERLRSAHPLQMPSYGHHSSAKGSFGASRDLWHESAQVYWERIHALRGAYSEKLRTALRALAHNTAPPNSVYSVKAQSMMQNIGLVLNILHEEPSTHQARKLDVLHSIERFMQMSVNPIVHKVLHSRALNGATCSVANAVASPLSTESQSQRNDTSRHGFETANDLQSSQGDSLEPATRIMTSSTHMMVDGPSPSLEGEHEGRSVAFATKATGSFSEDIGTTETRRPSLSSDDYVVKNRGIDENVDETLKELSELADIEFGDPEDAALLAKENQAANGVKRKVDDV